MICGNDTLKKYVSSAIAHGEASERGDHRSANACYEKLVECFSALRSSGKVETLSRLLDHENASVRLWAATHLLNMDEKSALATLTKLAQSDEFESFSAQIVIDQLEKGEFVPPE